MAKQQSNSLAWFLAGVTVGVAGAILYAPQSGEETREALARATREGREKLERSRRQAAERGREFYEQGRRFANEAAESGREAVERGKKAVSNLRPKEESTDEIEEPLGI
jgi:gas vesicle protein